MSARRLRTLGVVSVAALALSSGLAASSALDGDDLSAHGGATRLDGDQTDAVRDAVEGGTAQNVILLIGDGMGDSEITVARNYAEGAAGRFAGIDALPLTGQYTTYSLNRTDGKPDYVPDSAATGSAWSTGTKTYDNAISVDLDGDPQQTLLELAQANGLKTGDVSTAELQDATPAVQVAHIAQRSCYGPDQTSSTPDCQSAALENGGLGSITEQLLTTRPDVTLGGGAATFSQIAKDGDYEGMTLMDQAEARGYNIVDDAAGLDAVDTADQDEPLLGLFAQGNMPVRYTGPPATVGGSTQPAVRCTDNAARPATQPTLAQMTTKAIDLLDNPNGFFLQVEGASIDKQDHAADACGQIGETVDLDEAVQVALEYAEEQGNTSVFVTADHAHTSQIIEVGSSSPGKTVTLETEDGAPMTINYATSTGTSQQHTGTQLRVAGYGPQAANIVGLTDQTDLFFTISRALNLVDDPAEASADGTVKVTPGKVKQGKKATIKVSKFDGDSTVEVVVSGPGPDKTQTLDLSGGKASTSLTLNKPGKYTVTVTGNRSAVSASAKVTVVKKR